MTRGAETKQQTARRFVGRLTLASAFFALLAASLVARAVHLQVFNRDFLNQQADTRHLRKERFPRIAERLPIATASLWLSARRSTASGRIPGNWRRPSTV